MNNIRHPAIWSKVAALWLAMTAATASAHNMSMSGSKSGLFGLKPEYIHVLLNPLLAYGLGVGVVVLIAGLLRRNPSLQVTGLAITALCSAAAWPVLHFGQHAYNSLSPLLDDESHAWLDAHMDRAERFIYFFYATTLLAAMSLILRRKFTKAAHTLAISTAVLGLASLGIGAWIARAGGQVSHSEFRTGGPPPTHDEPKK
jgi:hypothetical protein